MTTEEETDADTIVKRHATNVQLDIDPFSKLYAKVAHKHMMTFQDYCSRMQSLNTKQCEIVMYNRAWCKSYIDGMWHGQTLHGYRVFLSGSGETGTSHVLQLIQWDICYMLNHTINPDDDQPLVLVTAPTGSAAFQVGGSTIHSAFLIYDKSRTKPSWEKHSIMQLKLQKFMLSITDEISMVSFKQYQQMNKTMSIVKGTSDGNWGDICVLAVGDLYQLPPVGQSSIYISPHTAHTLDDFAPNGWEDMKLHELTEIMWQKGCWYTSTQSKKKSNNNNQAGSSSTIGPKPHIVVPYHQGLSESYKNICEQYGIDVHLKGGQTIKDHLMSPKDKDPINKKVGSYTGLSVTG